MSEPREPLKEGGLKKPQEKPAPDHTPGLSKTGGGENRGDGLDEDARSGMLGEGESADRGGMADEG